MPLPRIPRRGVQVADRDGSRMRAHRFRPIGSPDTQHWPHVTVSDMNDEFTAIRGAKDPAGHQALSLGGYPPGQDDRERP